MRISSTFLLIIIMAVLLVTATLTTSFLFYQTALSNEETRLKLTAHSQARLIEAISSFDAEYSTDFPGGNIEATLSQIRDAQTEYEAFGRTGEFTLAKLEGNEIVFLLRHRHSSQTDAIEIPRVVLGTGTAEPMELALQGQSGTVVGNDYRGEVVLAAYEPVHGTGMGIVAKIDLKEIQAPYLRIGLISSFIVLLLAGAGAFLFRFISNPLTRRTLESERKYRLLFDNLQTGIVVHAPDSQVISCNQSACEMLALTEDQMRGKTSIDPHWRFQYGDESVMPLEAYPVNIVVTTRKPLINYVLGVVTPTRDSVTWVLVDAYPVFSNDSELDHIVVTFVNITHRVQAEQRVKEGAEEQTALNEELSSTNEELTATNEELEAQYEELCVTTDELVDSQEALKRSENTFKALYDNAPLSYQSLDEQGNVIDVNLTWLATLGYEKDEIIGTPYAELLQPDGQQHFELNFPAFKKRGYVHDVRFSLRHKDGHYLDVSFEGCVGYNPDGSFRQTYCVFKDITEQAKTEKALQESERKYRSFVENFQGIAFRGDMQFKPIFFHGAVEEITGYQESDFIAGQPCWDKIIHSDDVQAIYDEAPKLRSVPGYKGERDYRIVRKDGEVRWMREINGTVCDDSGQPEFVEGAIYDITELRDVDIEKAKLEEQLRQTQKLEAIGTLAGGIAHDFNNILFAILGNADLASEIIPEDSPARENLSEVVTAGNRAAELVKQILTFARKADKIFVSIELSMILKETVRLLRATLPTTIEINLQIDTNKSQIKADPTEIHQVVMNLCTNAGQAMMEHGGVLQICLEKAVVSESDIQQQPALQSENYLMLSVSDTGPGMPPEIQERIFEPFFTTKETGQGTGLGLAVVHGIVHDLGGTITVHSEIDQGTTFKVCLPLAVSDKVPEETSKEEIPRGTERVMVVDDEPVIARTNKAMLENLGYEVEAFSNSEEALKAFLEKPKQYDVIFTDQTMPRLTGAELAKKVLAQHPSQPIILSTGFSQTIPKTKAMQIGIAAYLKKPISNLELAKAIRKVLDSSSNTSNIQE